MFVLIAIAFGCNTPAEKKEDTFNYDLTYEFEVPESGIAFILPKEYIKTSVEEYKELIKSADLSDDIKENQEGVLSRINSSFPNFDILVDTLTYENLIWIIRKGPHIELTPETSKLAVQVLTQNNFSSNEIIQNEEVLGQKLVSKKWYKYVQLNIKQTSIQGERYFTHYLISTKNHTFGISFMNKENNDFKEYINRLKTI